jgi:glutamate synthase (NADPH/NADH) large chain
LKEAQKRYIKAVDKGMLKVMAKMGISTYQPIAARRSSMPSGSSRASCAVPPAPIPKSGAGLRQVARETAERHRQAFGDAGAGERARCRWRIRLSHSRRGARVAAVGGRRPAACGARQRPDKYRAYAQQINDQSEQ